MKAVAGPRVFGLRTRKSYRYGFLKVHGATVKYRCVVSEVVPVPDEGAETVNPKRLVPTARNP